MMRANRERVLQHVVFSMANISHHGSALVTTETQNNKNVYRFCKSRTPTALLGMDGISSQVLFYVVPFTVNPLCKSCLERTRVILFANR